MFMIPCANCNDALKKIENPLSCHLELGKTSTWKPLEAILAILNNLSPISVRNKRYKTPTHNMIMGTVRITGSIYHIFTFLYLQEELYMSFPA